MKKNMEAEEIAILDLFIKIERNTEGILDIDNLIITDNQKEDAESLKKSASSLNTIKPSNPNSELYLTWKNLFTSQIKFSVDYIKKL